MNRLRLAFCFLILASVASSTSLAQSFQAPRPSPKAVVTQTIGITEVTITYSRPGVKGRTIWGGLVPYDTLWRTGANEATTISFTDTMSVEGTPVPPGTYSLATIPGRTSWTIILNKDKDLLGTVGYKQANDLLRFTVKPESGEFEERMSFQLSDVTDNAASVVLRWEKLKITFRLEVDTKSLVLKKAREATGWQFPMQAANYCLTNNINLDEAMKWINLSTSIQETYRNLSVKARLLERTGLKKDAIPVMERAIGMGKATKDAPTDLHEMGKILAGWR